MAVIECTKGSIWLGLRSKDLLNLQLKTELYAGLQGSVATHLVFGGIFKYSFVTNFLLSLTMKEIWKSVNIWWSYGQQLGVLFFWDTV